MLITRRKALICLTGLIVAPIIVKADSLMKVRDLLHLSEDFATPNMADVSAISDQGVRVLGMMENSALYGHPVQQICADLRKVDHKPDAGEYRFHEGRREYEFSVDDRKFDKLMTYIYKKELSTIPVHFPPDPHPLIPEMQIGQVLELRCCASDIKRAYPARSGLWSVDIISGLRA